MNKRRRAEINDLVQNSNEISNWTEICKRYLRIRFSWFDAWDEGKKLSEKYINKQINNIKIVLNYGVKNKYLTENPVKGFKTLRAVKNSEDVQYWSPDQIKYMLSKIDDKFTNTDTQYIKCLFTFAYFNGFRKGEIMALKWKNIGFNEKKITVDYHINEKGEIIKGRKMEMGIV